ncbi:MAG: hypothetical protein AAB368_10025, partial [bacterium]
VFTTAGPAELYVSAGGTLVIMRGQNIGFPPGVSFTMTVVGQVTTVCAATSVSDTSYISFSNECPSSSVNMTSASTPFNVSPPVLSFTVSKTLTPANPVIGAAFTYRIVVMNTGAATIANALVTDTLPSVLTSVTTTGAGTPTVSAVAGGSLYVWAGQGITMPPGTGFGITITGQVAGVCAATFVSNTAYVTLSSACPSSSQTVGAAATNFTVVPPTTTVAVTKSHSATTLPGQTVTYRLIVTNTGSATLTSLTVSDTLSALVAFAGESNSAGLVHASAGSVHGWAGAVVLAPQGSVTVTVDAVVGCGAGTVNNVGFAAAASACGVAQAASAVDSFAITAYPAALSVAKTVTPASPAVGGTVTYR